MGVLGVKSDETYVCAPSPFQHAVADALRLGDEFFDVFANRLCGAATNFARPSPLRA